MKKGAFLEGQNPSLRPEVFATHLTYHGAMDYAKLELLELDPGEVLDFSVNSNPYGP